MLLYERVRMQMCTEQVAHQALSGKGIYNRGNNLQGRV